MLTQTLDTADPVLAFTVGWVRALAARVEHLHVICLSIGHADLPANVTVWSMGKERGYGRVREFAAFYKALKRVIRQVDIVFSHMIPRYAWLSAPYAMLYRKPRILWYAHRQIDWELRLALTVCTYVVTSTPSAFPLPTGKVRVFGQGIDIDLFSPDPQCPPDVSPLITYVARLMPIKAHESLLRAIAEIPGVRVALVGAVPPGQDPAYLAHLQTLARTLDISDRVLFPGALSQEAVRDIQRRATVAVNLSPRGLFDKAALESMLVGTPTIVTNPAFDSLLGTYASRLRITGSDDVQALVDALNGILALPQNERSAMGLEIRERVKAEHSLDHLMDRLVSLMASAG